MGKHEGEIERDKERKREREMRLDKACLSACIKPSGAAAIAALLSVKSLNRLRVFEKMSRKVTACLNLGLFCNCECV